MPRVDYCRAWLLIAGTALLATGCGGGALSQIAPSSGNGLAVSVPLPTGAPFTPASAPPAGASPTPTPTPSPSVGFIVQ